MTARAAGQAPATRRRRAVEPETGAAPSRPAALMSFAKRDRATEVEDRIPLFDIDGVEYTIPAVVRPGDARAYLAVTSGMENEAMRLMYLLRELAGPDALTALLGQADTSEDDWRRLNKIVLELVFGPLEASGN